MLLATMLFICRCLYAYALFANAHDAAAIIIAAAQANTLPCAPPFFTLIRHAASPRLIWPQYATMIYMFTMEADIYTAPR